MEPKTKRIELTETQWRKLCEVVNDATDRGPEHEGWCSPLLSEVQDIVDRPLAIE